jgi:hypothetical protein
VDGLAKRRNATTTRRRIMALYSDNMMLEKKDGIS